MSIFSSIIFLLLSNIVIMSYSFRAFPALLRSKTHLTQRLPQFSRVLLSTATAFNSNLNKTQTFPTPNDDDFQRVFKHLDAETLRKVSNRTEPLQFDTLTQQDKLNLVKDIFHYFYHDKYALLPKQFVSELLNVSIARFRQFPNVVPVARQRHGTLLGDVTIFGDLHGQFHDFYHIVQNTINNNEKNNTNSNDDEDKENHNPNIDPNSSPSYANERFFRPENTFIFNGDIADRGPMACEIFFTLLLYATISPQSVLLLRGNHETSSMTTHYGFSKEVSRKYGRDTYHTFLSLFQALPIAAVVEEEVFVVHGGLGPRAMDCSFAQLNALHRLHYDESQSSAQGCGSVVLAGSGEEVAGEEVFSELLWSDPRDGLQGFKVNKARGGGLCFGADVTAHFLSRHRLQLLVRSHECVAAGVQVLHGGNCVTLFSAPNYCGVQGNLGAVLCFPGGSVSVSDSVVPVLRGNIMQYHAQPKQSKQ